MKLLEKTDEEILEIANPLWDDLVKYSNKKDYFGFVKDFFRICVGFVRKLYKLQQG